MAKETKTDKKNEAVVEKNNIGHMGIIYGHNGRKKTT